MTKQASHSLSKDEFDLNVYRQALTAHQKDPETVSHQALKEELGFLDEKSL